MSHLKICMEPEKTKNNQSNLVKLDFNLYYKTVLIKTVWSWHKNRHIDQWNRIENPEMALQLYGQLIFNKAGKTIHWGKKTVSSINGAGKIGQELN